MPRRAWILIIILALWMPAAANAWEVILHEGRRHVPLEDISEFYSLGRPISNGKKFTLTSPKRTIRGEVGTREIFINNVKLILCFPIVQKNGRTLISAMDVTKIIEPVMRPGKIKNAGTLRTVVLDAGHGGHDSGATSVFGREKDFTLDVVLRARQLLLQQGYDVKLTRTNDTFIPLERRAAIANRYRDAVFVSVHFNKSKSATGTGIETYALSPRGVPSMDEERVSFGDMRQQPGNIRDAENIALATLMHSAMLKNMRLPDRGIKRARFVVIRDVTIPGVLLEGGFVCNPVDGRLVASQDFRQRMAQSIVDAVGNYKRMVANELPDQAPTLVVSAAGAAGAAGNAPPRATPPSSSAAGTTPMAGLIGAVSIGAAISASPLTEQDIPRIASDRAKLETPSLIVQPKAN